MISFVGIGKEVNGPMMRLLITFVGAVLIFGQALTFPSTATETTQEMADGLLAKEYMKADEVLTAYQVRLYERVRNLKRKHLELERVLIGGLGLVLVFIAVATWYLGRKINPQRPNPIGDSPPVPEDAKKNP